MCGRYATSRRAADLSSLFEAVDETGAAGEPALRPNYNLAPTAAAPLVRMSERLGRRVLSVARSGLLPHWATDRRIAARMINARAETVATARAYADSFARRRALIPADGWYEWRRERGARQAYYMTPADGSVLAFAGIWSRWGPDGLLTFSVLTTAAVGELARVHDRMPLLLPPQAWTEWLTAPAGPELLRPPPAAWLEGLEIRPVGPAVGNVRNNGPELTARVEVPAVAETLF